MRSDALKFVAPVGIAWLFVTTILLFLAFGVPHCEAEMMDACTRTCGPGNVLSSGSGAGGCRCLTTPQVERASPSKEGSR